MRSCVKVLILEVKDSRTDSWPWRVPLTVFISMGKIFSLDPIDDTVGKIYVFFFATFED